jgi:hypothetical protein
MASCSGTLNADGAAGHVARTGTALVYDHPIGFHGTWSPKATFVRIHGRR